MKKSSMLAHTPKFLKQARLLAKKFVHVYGYMYNTIFICVKCISYSKFNTNFVSQAPCKILMITYCLLCDGLHILVDNIIKYIKFLHMLVCGCISIYVSLNILVHSKVPRVYKTNIVLSVSSSDSS